MRMTATALIFILALLLIVAAYLSHSLVILHRVAVVDVVEGQADVLTGGRGKPVALRTGRLVREGDVVRTGPRSAVELRWVRWVGGMRVRLGENTSFKVKKAIVNQSTKDEESRLWVDRGSIWVRLRKVLRARSKFEVETPTVVAAVRGTTFGVTVEADGTTHIEVYEGQVEALGAGGVAASLTSGSATSVARRQRATSIRPLSAAERKRWRSLASIVGPFLDVSQPQDGVAVAGDALVVEGRAEPGAKVTVNGAAVALGGEGEFATSVRLAPGQATITVRAGDEDGRQTVVTRSLAVASAPSGRPEGAEAHQSVPASP